MTDLTDLIIKIVDANQEIDYARVVKVFLLFFVVLWITVSYWVFLDSSKRYQSKKTALLVSLFVLIFNLPGLFLYIVLRPEHSLNIIPDYDEIMQTYENATAEIIIDSNKNYSLQFNVDIVPVTEGKSKLKFSVATFEQNIPIDINKANLLKEEITFSKDNEVLVRIPENTLMKRIALRTRTRFSKMKNSLLKILSNTGKQIKLPFIFVKRKVSGTLLKLSITKKQKISINNYEEIKNNKVLEQLKVNNTIEKKDDETNFQDIILDETLSNDSSNIYDLQLKSLNKKIRKNRKKRRR